MDHLTTLFGMQVVDVDKDFKAIDANNDGLVTKQESFNALKNLARAAKPYNFDVRDSNGLSFDQLELLNNWLDNYQDDLAYYPVTYKVAESMRNLMNKVVGGDWSCHIYYHCGYGVYGSTAKYVEFYQNEVICRQCGCANTNPKCKAKKSICLTCFA